MPPVTRLEGIDATDAIEMHGQQLNGQRRRRRGGGRAPSPSHCTTHRSRLRDLTLAHANP